MTAVFLRTFVQSQTFGNRNWTYLTIINANTPETGEYLIILLVHLLIKSSGSVIKYLIYAPKI